MRIKATLYKRPDWDCKQPEGTFEWDSETGRLGGSLADRIAHCIEDAQKDGGIARGPVGEHIYPTPDPLHDPAQMAVVLAVMGFFLYGPELAELAAHYPQMPTLPRTPGVQ